MKNLEKVKIHFEKLVENYQKLGEIHRAGSFRSAIEKLEQTFSQTDLPNDIPQLKSIKGIGPSTIAEIREILTTGSSSRLVDLEKQLANTTTTEEVEDFKQVLNGLLK